MVLGHSGPTIQLIVIEFIPMEFYKRTDRVTGLEIRGCREPRAPLNSLGVPSNYCREPKVALISIRK